MGNYFVLLILLFHFHRVILVYDDQRQRYHPDDAEGPRESLPTADGELQRAALLAHTPTCGEPRRRTGRSAGDLHPHIPLVRTV